MARRLMTRNIYHYQKKLALEAFLIKLLVSLAESLEDHAPYAGIKSSRLGKFLLAANKFNQTIPSEKGIEQHKQRFLSENYANYKELCDYDVFAVVNELAHTKSNHPAAQIAQRIQNRRMPKIIRLDHVNIQAARRMLDEFKTKYHDDFQDWQLTIIKTPHQAYSADADPILVVSEHGVVKPISETSLMINAISDKYESTSFLCMDSEIMNHPEVEKMVKHLMDNEKAATA